MHVPTPAILPAATMACKLAEISLSGALLSARVQLAVTRVKGATPGTSTQGAFRERLVTVMLNYILSSGMPPQPKHHRYYRRSPGQHQCPLLRDGLCGACNGGGYPLAVSST